MSKYIQSLEAKGLFHHKEHQLDVWDITDSDNGFATHVVVDEFTGDFFVKQNTDVPEFFLKTTVKIFDIYHAKISEPNDIPSYIDGPEDNEKKILWFHGGCFKQGNHMWSGHFRKVLRDNGFTVITFDLQKAQNLRDVRCLVKKFRGQHKLYVGGESSGGFFAVDLATRFPGDIQKCIAVAPVLTPNGRFENLSDEKKRLQTEFFMMRSVMFEIEEDLEDRIIDTETELWCLFGKQDKDSDPKLSTEFTNKIVVKGDHKDICKKVHPMFNVIVSEQ
jgi:predicted esterase YcpF (UPF0227 family)